MMKRILAGMLTAGMLFAGSAFAVIYQYVDDSGQVNYTNDLSSVPMDKLADIIEIKESESNAMPERSSPAVTISSPPSDSEDSSRKFQIKKKREQRKKLEAEYNALLKEKESLDNNTSFQKRRKKRKYQNRPYIQELIRKEEQLTNRLAELEAELGTIEK